MQHLHLYLPQNISSIWRKCYNLQRNYKVNEDWHKIWKKAPNIIYAYIGAVSK
jgi:hypothetical protein